MRHLFTALIFFLTIFYTYGQNCPYIEFRNNGNGQSNNCSNVNGTPMAANFAGTPYAVNFIGMAKTGNIRFVFPGTITNPPAIKKIWLGSTLSSVVAGPASVPEQVNGGTRVSYCFYGQNLPPSGFYTIEFVNPQNDQIFSLCGFSGSSNAPANPPVILSQPLSQSVCTGNTLTLSVNAQASYGGSLSYQWKKDGLIIAGATSSTYVKSGVTSSDAGSYSCTIGESAGTFIISAPASVQVINCSSNTYMDACGSGPVTTTATNSWNSAWVDYDNDGWEDLYVLDKSENTNNYLYDNTGYGFALVSSSQLSVIMSKSVNSTWADYDRDGNKDVYITNASGNPGFLYRNMGSGMFQLITNAGLDADAQYAHGAAWCDFDLDGYADLIVTNFFETRFHQLYKNKGDGTFTKMENTPVTLESHRAMAPILCDFDNDGYTDIFIPNGNNKPNSLFRNKGNFQFEKITAAPFGTDAYNSVGGAWGDYDNDGWPDLFVCNASDQNNNLYKNNGDGTFTTITGINLVLDGGHSHGANWMDIDNDGDFDLFVTNDQGPNFLYINQGGGTFERVMDEAIATDLGLDAGQAWADYNKDGMLDVMISSHSGQPDHLYCGKPNGKHWINIRLAGVVSNPDAIGARIGVFAGGQWQYRQNHPISGFGSQNSFRQHFGLGANTIIEKIEVKWPSGYKQTVSNIQTDQFITITEEPANLLTGFAFSDINNNCIWDEGEEKLEGIQFSLSPVNTKFSSSEAGIYQQRVAAGNYSVNLEPNEYWEMNCEVNINVSGANNTVTNNLPLTKSQNGYDLQINGGITAWRRGFTGESVIQYSNLGTADAIKAKIELTYPDGIVLQSASIPWDEQIGNTYIWYMDTIEAGEMFNIQLRDSVTLDVVIGEELTVSGSTSADGQDLRTSNNTFTVMSVIVGAIDPNDILVTPEGKGKEGFIPADQMLRYHIRFQNVGTYHASRVVLENKLSQYLDLSTFRIESYSHPGFNYMLNQDGLLTVRFNNIELPDSTSNEPESHGFFIYTVLPKKDVKGGNRIENSVLITFDYEDPVMSNTVVNTIRYTGKPEVSDMIIFPNPAAGEISILADNFSPDLTLVIKSMKVIGADGRVIKEISNHDDLRIELNVSDLQPGLYTVLGADEKGTYYRGKFIKI